MRHAILLVAVVAMAATLAFGQRPEKVEPKFEPPQVVAAAPAPYPPTSIAEGTVVFTVTIGAMGNIEAVNVVRGVPSLTEAAQRSLMQWKFRPATLDGRPVRASIVAAFTFTRPVVLPQQPPK